MGKSVSQVLADVRVDIDEAAPGLLPAFDRAAHTAMTEINRVTNSAERRWTKWVAAGYVGVFLGGMVTGWIMVDLVTRYGY